jgi:hypothetical protein
MALASSGVAISSAKAVPAVKAKVATAIMVFFMLRFL